MNNNTEKISWRNFLVELWRLLSPFRSLGASIILVILTVAVLDLFKPYILKVLVDGLNGFDRRQFFNLVLLIVVYLTADGLRSLIQYFGNRRVLRLLVAVEYFLGIKAQEKLLNLSLSYHEQENTGSKIVKIERGVDKISHLLDNIFWELLPTLVQLAFTITALFWVDWRLGLPFLFFAASFLLITYWANKRMYPIRKNIYKDYEIASGQMAQAIININAVQSFVQEKNELARFTKTKSQIQENENKQWGWMMKIGLLNNYVANVGRAVVLFLGVYFVWQEIISVGTLIFAFTLSENAFGSLYRLSRFYDRLEEGREGVNRLIALFNRESNIVNKATGIKPRKITGEIIFENVSFSYGDNKHSAIHNLNLKINSGCVTALVGPSGGGKTTLARLVYRHYDPQNGRVLLDNCNLRDYDLYGFRRFFAIVPQEVEIFDLNVAENIAYANPRASQREIKAAARIANAEEFINKLEQGYQTLVGERGIKLSGGQRQRIGIARAILANPRVLIFDEATSSLDSQSERLIAEAINKISQNRTMIIIAHRLSTIRRADKIVVLENGQVVEEGNHVELAQVDGGLYAKLLNLQSMGDISD